MGTRRLLFKGRGCARQAPCVMAAVGLRDSVGNFVSRFFDLTRGD